MFRDILANTELKPGRRLSHGAYERLKGELQRTALSSGYLDARYRRNELRVDPAKLSAEAILDLQTGERYRFGPTTIEQDAIDPKLAARYLRYHEGDYFDASKLLTTQFALDDTLYFTSVEIIPSARDTQTYTVPITVRAQTGKRNKYTVAFGYGTDTRFRGHARLGRSAHQPQRAPVAGRPPRGLDAAEAAGPLRDPRGRPRARELQPAVLDRPRGAGGHGHAHASNSRPASRRFAAAGSACCSRHWKRPRAGLRTKDSDRHASRPGYQLCAVASELQSRRAAHARPRSVRRAHGLDQCARLGRGLPAIPLSG